jgi:hypothetical protein
VEAQSSSPLSRKVLIAPNSAVGKSKQVQRMLGYRFAIAERHRSMSAAYVDQLGNL